MQAALNILHVEDDPGDALLMQEVLLDEVGGNAYDIVHVESLKDALGTMKTKGFNAILLDLGLKDVSGVDNVRAIKEENPDMPIVVLTGMDSEDTAMQALRYGAQEYLVKGHGDGKVIRMAIKSSIERKAVERKLYNEANYDELTGLANRRLFMEYLEKALAKANRWKRRETLMFIDINHFKHINDSFGHEAGDKVLQMVAARIGEVLRQSDIIARYGGDEFTILLDSSAQNVQMSCTITANKILEAMKESFDLGGGCEVSVSASIGIAVYPDSGRDAFTLIHAADLAMYVAKVYGPNHYFFAKPVAPVSQAG